MTDEVQQALDKMFPGMDRWTQCVCAARILEISPRTIDSWRTLPRYARIIAEIYTGEVTLGELEDRALYGL